MQCEIWMLCDSSVQREKKVRVLWVLLEDEGQDGTRAPPREYTVVLLSPDVRFVWLMPQTLKETHYLLEVHPLSMQAHHSVAHLFCSSWLCGKNIRRFLVDTRERVQGPNKRARVCGRHQHRTRPTSSQPVFTLHIQTLLRQYRGYKDTLILSHADPNRGNC